MVSKAHLMSLLIRKISAVTQVQECQMPVIFGVFARPWTRPGDLDFLAAYSTRASAEEFVLAQDDSVRDNLLVVEIEIDRHPRADGFWRIPGSGAGE